MHVPRPEEVGSQFEKTKRSFDRVSLPRQNPRPRRSVATWEGELIEPRVKLGTCSLPDLPRIGILTSRRSRFVDALVEADYLDRIRLNRAF
jgi:hypothetical protein